MSEKTIWIGLCIVLFILIMGLFASNPIINYKYFKGCSMYPEIDYHSIDFLLSTKVTDISIGDIVVFKSVFGNNKEHKIVGKCEKGYYIAGTEYFDKDKGYTFSMNDPNKIHVSIKECIPIKDIKFKRIWGISLGKSICE